MTEPRPIPVARLLTPEEEARRRKAREEDEAKWLASLTPQERGDPLAEIRRLGRGVTDMYRGAT